MSTWKLPGRRRPKKPRSRFTIGTFRLKKNEQVPTKTEGASRNAVLAYEVVIEEDYSSHRDYDTLAREFAIEWFIHNMYEEIRRHMEESEVELHIGVSSPYRGRMICSLYP